VTDGELDRYIEDEEEEELWNNETPAGHPAPAPAPNK